MLIRKARTLKNELLNEKLKLEKVTAEQSEHASILETLDKQISEHDSDLEKIETGNQLLEHDINTFEGERNQLKNEIKDRQEAEAARIKPQIDR